MQMKLVGGPRDGETVDVLSGKVQRLVVATYLPGVLILGERRDFPLRRAVYVRADPGTMAFDGWADPPADEPEEGEA